MSVYIQGEIEAEKSKATKQNILSYLKKNKINLTSKEVFSRVALLSTGWPEDVEVDIVEFANFSYSKKTKDNFGHSCILASIIAGTGMIKGVSPLSKILCSKVYGDHGGSAPKNFYGAITWAVVNNADLVVLQDLPVDDEVVILKVIELARQHNISIVVPREKIAGIDLDKVKKQNFFYFQIEEKDEGLNIIVNDKKVLQCPKSLIGYYKKNAVKSPKDLTALGFLSGIFSLIIGDLKKNQIFSFDRFHSSF
jgi:hypothetical protein